MDKDKKLMKSCSVRYRYLREDPTTGIHYGTISFPTGNGRRGKIEVPASTLSNRAELRRQLQDRDAKLPTEQDQQNALLAEISIAQPELRQVYAKAAGWSLDRKWFVTGRQVIGKAPSGQLPGRPKANALGEPGQLRCRGNAHQWGKCIGKLALASSVVMLTVCTAFAAPLLIFTNRTSFAICLFGRTRSGKTLASLCAASMTGIGYIDDLVGWRSTDSAIEERLADFTDTIFVLDDISAMDTPERERYIRLRNFAYMLSTNQGKARARFYKQSAGVNHGRHRSIVLTSAETSIASLAQRARRQRYGGEELRLIDLPIADSDNDDIFDRMPSSVRQADSGKWRSEAFGAMAEGCNRYHGAAFRAYLSGLISQRLSMAAKVDGLIEKFVEHLGEAAKGSEARDLAEKFGLIYAGGMTGVELKLVPWTDSDVLSAVTVCYRRARNLLTDDRQLLKSGLEVLVDALRQLPRHAAKQGSRARYDHVDGYQESDPGGKACIIKIEAFNRLLPDDRRRNLVHHWLLKHHVLVAAQTRAGGQSSGSRPATQFTWPDGERRRSMKIDRRLLEELMLRHLE